MQRAYPHKEVPVKARLQAAQQAKQMIQDAAALKDADTVTWTQAGPENVPGRVTDIAIPSSQPNTIYVAAAAGGVFKSTNAGASWTAIFDDVGVQSIGAIAVHPSDPDILYVGTGEANSSGDSYEGTGMYKTTDGGTTWTYLGLPNSFHIGRIVIDPLRPDTIFVAVAGKLFGTNPDRGLYRSVDGGITWEQKLFISDTTACIDVAFQASTGTVYAAMWHRYRNPRERRVGGWTSGLYRSTDYGETWTLLTNGLPPQSETLGRIGVSIEPVTGVVYAIFCDHPGNFIGLYKSIDNGNTWTQTNDGDLNGMLGGFGWYFGQVRVAPNNPNTVYALGVDLYKSSDGGTSWDWVGGGIHVDHHAMVINAGNVNDVYVGCDGGINHTTDGGNNWTNFPNMPNTQFYAITIDRNNPVRLYGGTQDNGTLRTLTGATNDWQHIHGGDGFYVVVDHSDPNIIYAEYQWGYLDKSTNGGASFSWAMNGIDYNNDRHNWNTPFVMDPSDHNTLYYGSNKLYKTTDGADNWFAVSDDLTNGDDPGNLTFGTITTIAVARTDNQVVYVGTDDANVWITTDGCTSWQNVSASLPDRWVTRVTTDPHDASIAYVTLSGYSESSLTPHIYRTTDYGLTWTAIHGNMPDAPINDVIVDPHDDSMLYIATDFGVFYTEDLGQTWSPLGTGLPVVPVHDLEFDVATRTLVAGTHGRSMYRTTIDCPDITDSDSDGINDGCDNCPTIANANQQDTDNDGIGDICDNCPDTYNVSQLDSDSDGVGNLCDNCPDIYNPGQEDENNDGIGDACCCVNRGNVDDIVGSNPIDVADLTYLVAYLFSGGPEPPCLGQGNVDGIVGTAGPIDVSDLTYLVDYLFSGGPQPPSCP